MELKKPTPLGGEAEEKGTLVIQQPVERRYASSGNFILVVFKKIKDKISKIDWSKVPKKKILLITFIGLPILLLFILSILIINYTNSEPYRMSKQFLEYIDENNTNKAYQMTTDAYRVLVTKNDFQKIVDRLNSVDLSKAKIKEKSTVEVPGMGVYAYIKYKISGYYVDITMFNDTVDWGIHTIEISTSE